MVAVEAADAAEVVVADAEAKMKIGLGYRRELSGWLLTKPRGVECLEITAEHFYEDGHQLLTELAKEFPLLVHGLGLSLGTPGPLDTDKLERFATVSRAASAQWISEHVAFTRTAEIDLGHLNPVPPTRDTVKVMAEHARELAARCCKPLLLENITSHLRLEGDLSETEFLNELCAQANCGLLLDVTNLFINSCNHCFDPLEWLQELDASRVRQLHIVGYSRDGARYTDGHSEPIQPELLDLARFIIQRSPVQAIILERDENFPGPQAMAQELAKLENLRATN